MALDPTVPVREAAVNAIADKVGNMVSTIWDYSLGLVANIIFLSRKSEEVAGEMKMLEDLRKDLMWQLADDEADVSYQLSGWMSRVSSLAEGASSFQRSFEDRSFCISRFCLGYDALELLRQAKKLAEEGKVFFSGAPPLSRPRGPDPVKQVPSQTSSSTVAGGKEALQRVQSCIMDDNIGIVGIYGMGGVGKTTLLKIINNEFLQGEACRDKFEVAIWVTVSRDVQISAIRKSIADRLKLPSDAPKQKLFGELSKKRFMLLLDDVWEKLDLMEIGIPHPKISDNNKSKILFTTRKIDVCGEMDVDEKVKINLLDDQSSRDLFRSKFGREAAHALDDPNIRQLAEEVVRRCGGLPIALITVGRAMSNARTAYDWKDAIRKLRHRPADLSPGMEEEVLKSLKFSFEMLRNDALQNCLLYCALFPEDHEIPKEKIIDYWICEGFLDLEDFVEEINIEETRCRGNGLITELRNACLLEGGVSDDDEFVMLHDTVRDMALWIARHDFVVLAGSYKNASLQIPKLSTWESAKRISLIDNREMEEPPSSSPGQNLSCPNLTTLLLHESRLIRENILKDFFNFTNMAALRVLDLKSFPRANAGLREFPIGITSLISLRYLCLSSNLFASLPVELGNLTNLSHLILRHTRRLTSIRGEAISRLSRLRVLDMEGSRYKFGGDDDTRHPQLQLSDLANLKRLCELYLPKNCSRASLGVIAASPVLRRSTRNIRILNPSSGAGDTISQQIGSLSGLRRLQLHGNPSDDPAAVMVGLQLYPISRLRHLEVLHLRHVMIFSTIIHTSSSSRHRSEEALFPRLRELWIRGCDGCSELTWVGPLPCLEVLILSYCQGLREVLRVDGGGHDHHLITPIIIFPKLKHMTLWNLPSLRSISTSTLLFPCLKWLAVGDGCPLLSRLPLGSESAKNLVEIEGGRAWWDGLEWDNHADRQSFSSKFRELNYSYIGQVEVPPEN